MKVNASISISRIHPYREPDHIHIRVEDETSGCTFLDLELSLADFARAVTGLSAVKCQGELYEDAPVGKQRQVKEELVRRLGGYVTAQGQRAVAAEVLAPYEIDGWEGYASDLFNHRRRTELSTAGEEGYRVTFVRFVDPPEAPP